MTEKNSKIEMVKLADIILDDRLQCRAKIDMELAAEYGEAIKAGKKREGRPPVVFYDRKAKKYYLADGWHWWHGHSIAGIDIMECEVIEGTFQDALRFAVGANRSHGLKRNNADKRKAITVCLEDDELKQLSARQIAELVGVSDHLVSEVKSELEASSGYKQETVVGKDGKVRPAHKTEAGQLRECAVDGAESSGSESRPVTPSVTDGGSATSEPETEKPKTATTSAKDDIVRDAKGRPVPDDLLDVFAFAKLFENKVAAIGRDISEFEKIANEQPAGKFIAFQSLKITGNNYQGEIASSRPYIVCPACHGTKRDEGHPTGKDCKLCRADGKPQGWLPHGKWAGLSDQLKAVAQSYAKKEGA